MVSPTLPSVLRPALVKTAPTTWVNRENCVSGSFVQKLSIFEHSVVTSHEPAAEHVASEVPS